MTSITPSRSSSWKRETVGHIDRVQFWIPRTDSGWTNLCGISGYEATSERQHSPLELSAISAPGGRVLCQLGRHDSALRATPPTPRTKCATGVRRVVNQVWPYQMLARRSGPAMAAPGIQLHAYVIDLPGTCFILVAGAVKLEVSNRPFAERTLQRRGFCRKTDVLRKEESCPANDVAI
jgi:hypothetical protein